VATIDRWREIDYSGPEAEAFESFTRTIDLFGDGLVRLISSPGHSLGHQSVLLRLRDHYALVAGDAAMSTLGRERLIDGVVVDQDSYLRSGGQAPEETVRLVREAFVEALWGRVRGELPDVGPKGGVRWPPSFAVRRSAWHALDHAWEIQGRLEPAPASG